MTITHEFLLIIVINILFVGIFISKLYMSIKFIEAQIR